MKTFKSSDLTHKRAEVFKEAEKGGVIVQQCRTNGDVIQELVLMPKDKHDIFEGAYWDMNGHDFVD